MKIIANVLKNAFFHVWQTQLLYSLSQIGLDVALFRKTWRQIMNFLYLLLQLREVKSISVNKKLLITFYKFNASTIYPLIRNKTKSEIEWFYSVKKLKKHCTVVVIDGKVIRITVVINKDSEVHSQNPVKHLWRNVLGKYLMPDSSLTIFAKIVIINFEPSKWHLK